MRIAILKDSVIINVIVSDSLDFMPDCEHDECLEVVSDSMNIGAVKQPDGSFLPPEEVSE